jgi:hypothetical protein
MSIPLSTINARTQACALNNMAVTMMRRGEFQAAVSTLNDSLSIMFRQKDHHNNFAQERVTEASTLLSKLSTPRSFMAYMSVTAVDSNDIESLKRASLSEEASSPMAFFAVLVCDPCSSSSEDRIDFDRESGIILYNYGLACYLLSALAQSDHLKSDSVGSLLLSHTTFTNILLECEDATDDLESVFLAMLVLSCSGKVFRARNELANATEAEEAADTLLSAVQEEMSMYEIRTADVAAAAA